MDGTITGLTIRELLYQNPVRGEQKRGPKISWTNREIEAIKVNFPTGGLASCVELLPGRTASSIYQQAVRLKLKSPRTTRPRQRIKPDPHIDDAIRRGYANAGTVGRDAIKILANAISRDITYVRNRAKALGLVAPRNKEPRWTAEEDAFVKARAQQHPKTIETAMRKAGLTRRTQTAIILRIIRLGASTEDPDIYTGRGLARLMGVNSSTITAWIAKGWLKAKRHTAMRSDTEGDQWSIHKRHVRAFIIDNTQAVDVRRVDKHWFVDLLAHKD